MSSEYMTVECLDLAGKGLLSLPELQKYLSAAVEASAQDENMDSLLHKCARSGSLELCTELLDNGARINDLDKRGMSALFSATEYGRTDVVELFIDRGASSKIMREDTGWSILHMGAYNGHLETMTALLKKLPETDVANFINMGDKDQRTPLHIASFRSSTEMVRLLMERGAKPALQDIRHNTPQELALKVGKEQTVELFEVAGTTPKAHAFTNPQRRASSRDIAAAAIQAATAMAT